MAETSEQIDGALGVPTPQPETVPAPDESAPAPEQQTLVRFVGPWFVHSYRVTLPSGGTLEINHDGVLLSAEDLQAVKDVISANGAPLQIGQ